MKISTILTALTVIVICVLIGTITPIILSQNVNVVVSNNHSISATINEPSFLRPPGVNFYYLNTVEKVNAYKNVQTLLNSNLLKTLLATKEANFVFTKLGDPTLLLSEDIKEGLNKDAALLLKEPGFKAIFNH